MVCDSAGRGVAWGYPARFQEGSVMSATTSELEKLNELLKDFRFAMLTSRAEDGKLTAHPLTVQEA